LGALLYYLGIITLLDSLTTGIVLTIVGLIIGSGYHKFIEEKELLIRFGDEYRIYREKTPFLIPKLF
jgi:protein-S-isoprenylcysteine O-methyltransferase Ste14